MLPALWLRGGDETQAGAKTQAGDETQAKGLLLLQMVSGQVHSADPNRFSTVAYPAQQVAVRDLYVGNIAQGDQ